MPFPEKDGSGCSVNLRPLLLERIVLLLSNCVCYHSGRSQRVGWKTSHSSPTNTSLTYPKWTTKEIVLQTFEFPGNPSLKTRHLHIIGQKIAKRRILNLQQRSSRSELQTLMPKIPKNLVKIEILRTNSAYRYVE